MRPFDWEAAKRGKKVCTSNGAEVENLRFNEKVGIGKALLKSITIEHFPIYFDKQGYSVNPCGGVQLMMADDGDLEKMERGEHDHIEHNLEMVGKSDPIVEEAEKVDWTYWRHVFAGMAMQGLMADYSLKADSLTEDPTKAVLIARRSVFVADALVERLKENRK